MPDPTPAARAVAFGIVDEWGNAWLGDCLDDLEARIARALDQFAAEARRAEREDCAALAWVYTNLPEEPDLIAESRHAERMALRAQRLTAQRIAAAIRDRET